MKDLKGFMRAEGAKTGGTPSAAGAVPKDGKAPEGVSLSDFNPADVNMVQGLSDKYKNNQQQLVADILSAAQREKAAGTLDPAALEQFKKTVAPMLNAQQRMILDEILRAVLR